MSRSGDILKGVGIFFIGMIISITIGYIAEPLIDALNLISTETDITQIFWFFTIGTWIIITLIMPSYYVIRGLRTENKHTQQLKEITIAIILFLTSTIFIYKAWFMISALPLLTNETFLQILYWTSLTIIWTEITIIAPTYLIINAFKN